MPDISSAACFWSLFGEGAYDAYGTRSEAFIRRIEVGFDFVFRGEEMKGRAIVPEIILLPRLKLRKVCTNPCNAFGPRAKTPSRPVKRRLRNVQNGYVFVSQIEQVIDEETVPTTYINDVCACRNIKLFHELQRSGRKCLIPTEFLQFFCQVDVVPMGASVECCHGTVCLLATTSNIEEFS